MELVYDGTMGDSIWHGTCRIVPDGPVMAGEMGTWTITYIAGRYGIDNGGRLKLGLRLASDWGSFQTESPQEEGYFSVHTDGEARVKARVDQRPGYLRPWFKTVTIYVSQGSLREGDRVTMVLGDTSLGGPGVRAQTFREKGFRFLVLVDCFETGRYVPLPTSPFLDIRGGPPQKLVVVAPTEVVADESFRVVVRAEDIWGNPSHDYQGRVVVETPGMSGPSDLVLGQDQGGVGAFKASFTQEGIYRIKARGDEEGLEAFSNPIACRQDPPRYRPYWADLHGQTRSTVGTGTVQEYFSYARDVARVDVSSHQGNDFQVTQEAWKEVREGTRSFHQPGEFVTYLGYEWSGNHPAGGDHNVLWLEDDKPIYRSSHWLVPDTSDEHTDCYPITRLYEVLREEKAMIVPHIGGRPANLDFRHPQLEPAIEICSVHGRFEWFLAEALERGYRVGVLANGDDHTGRPGASRGTSGSFGVRGGLTCILARDLTREGIWEALRARRTYATTGERILLSFRCGQHLMGEEFEISQPPVIDVQVMGTSPLQSVDLVRGDEVIYAPSLVSRDSLDPGQLRIAWMGARIRGRGRHTVWDGTLSIEDGRFREVSDFAFDHLLQGVTRWSENQISWRSTTSGDLDGLLVALEGSSQSRMTFESGPCTFGFSLGQVREGPLEIEAGGVDQRVQVSLARSTPGPGSFSFSFRDTRPSPGLNPYYVRVLQEDGEMAWSSPLYIHYRPDR